MDESQEWLDELLQFSDVAPTVVYPDGRVEIGFEGGGGLSPRMKVTASPKTLSQGLTA